ASQAAARQVEELSARLDALGVEDPESGPRSIKALGERVGSILQEAHAAAEELRSQAKADAEAVRAEAATELDRLRLESEELRAEAAAEVDRLRAEAEEMRTNGLGVAQAEAASMRAGARQEAAAPRPSGSPLSRSPSSARWSSGAIRSCDTWPICTASWRACSVDRLNTSPASSTSGTPWTATARGTGLALTATGSTATVPESGRTTSRS